MANMNDLAQHPAFNTWGSEEEAPASSIDEMTQIYLDGAGAFNRWVLEEPGTPFPTIPHLLGTDEYTRWREGWDVARTAFYALTQDEDGHRSSLFGTQARTFPLKWETGLVSLRRYAEYAVRINTIS